MMTFPTIAAGTRANEAIGGYANFVAYCNALAAGVDSVTTTAAGAALKANNLSDLTSASTARTNLGLGTMATATASDYLSKAGNLGGIADLAVARTNLGLGTMATESASAYALLSGANTFTRGQLVVGSANEVQGRFQMVAGQSANAVTVENSSASVLASISAAGVGTFARIILNAADTGETVRYGYGAATAITSGSYNTALGNNALAQNTATSANTAVGWSAMRDSYVRASSVAIGANSQRYDTGVTAISDNVTVGNNTISAVGSTGGANSALGTNALAAVTSGANNVAFGFSAGRYSTTQSNELFINSINRTNRAGDIAGSIIYGVQNATPANQTLTLNALVTPTYGLKWLSGLEQTTVGAAGAASALPATPTKFLKVVDSSGATLVIPAYAAA